MRISCSIKKRCSYCKIHYRFKRLYLFCKNKKHKKHQ